jgi:UDP-glucose 4-epimerase
MARVLVTGGAGFVGSHLCAALRARGDEAVAIDDLSNGKRSNLGADVPLEVFDLAERGWMSALGGRRLDAVIHCAAQSSNALSFRDPMSDLRANQLATLNVLEFCRVESIRRLVFTSSMSVYGNPPSLPTPPEEFPRPLTYYALHKAASEGYIKLARDLDWTIFRLYTTYGFGQNLSNLNQGLVKIFLGFVLRGEPVRVRGRGDRLRDIIHVSYVVDAVMRSLTAPRSFGQTYNLGSGSPVRVSEIIGCILESAEKPADYPVVYEAGDVGDPDRTHADISLACRDLGWFPAVRPSEGIRMTVRQHVRDLAGTT